MMDRDPGPQGQTAPFFITIGTTTNNAVASQNLGFRARQLVCDNFSNQYVYVPAAGTWIPPNTQGYRILLPNATVVAEANVATAPNGAQAATIAGQTIYLLWIENVIPVTGAVTQQITAISNTSIDGTLINQAAGVTPVSTATSSSLAVAAVTGLRLMGWTVRETAGATAEIALRRGSSTGVKIMDRNMVANESYTDWLGDTGISASAGIYVDRTVSGNSEIEIYTKTQA